MGLEEEVRFCYQDNISVESNKFVQMLLLDVCFLLHSLYATNEIVEMPVSKDLQLHKGIGALNIETEKSDILIEISADQVKQGNADASQCQSTQTDTFHDLMQGRPQGNLDPIGMMYTSCITRDIFLLENQIPFFVLKRVYEILAYKKLVSTPLTETIAKHIEGILRKYTTAIGESDRPKDFQHLLHLCHLYFKPSQNIAQHHEYQVQSHYFYRLLGKFVRYFNYSNQCEDVSLVFNCQHIHSQRGNHMKCWRRAVQYHEAGVQFKKREHSMDDPHSLLDVVFDEGLLEVPRLIIDDKTCSLLRNFIAFEQACPKFGNDITAYVAFMSQLISTPS
ncbi:UPF0481 protein At3g47200-like [Miscanthus floridulus]|uniref:UPF0481 protein At3g47200-like n=1 Tax=Miscanthus floridulus TaxID=154761 RepID=UPI0034577326